MTEPLLKIKNLSVDFSYHLSTAEAPERHSKAVHAFAELSAGRSRDLAYRGGE